MALEKITKRSRPVWLRAIVIVCVLATGWHIFATFLWIAPASGLREIVPGKALSNYMLPIFGQSWSVFAPEPINGNITIKVRAAMGSDEGVQTTPWVNASDAELDLAHHNLFPPRAAILGLQQGTEYKTAFDKLSKDQQKIVSNGYFIGDDWLKRLQTDLLKSVKGNDKTKATSRLNVRVFIQQEAQTAAYATQVARATWGPEVERVQVSVSRQNVTPFKDRHNENVAPQPIRIVESGWRGPHILPGQDQDRFAEIFANLKGIK